jgi:hypothetical protein
MPRDIVEVGDVGNSVENEKWIFVSFADGNESITKAGKRIAAQALKLDIFHKIYVFNGVRLAKVDEDYRNVYFSESGKSRGFGYWVWKPIVLRYLEGQNHVSGDQISGVVYADAGCEIPINYYSRKGFLSIFESTKRSAVVADVTRHSEIKYTKRAIFKVLDPHYSHATTPQISATWLAVRFNSNGRDFLNSWARLALQNNGELINDLISKEDPRFVENRHDQSIFSLLFKVNSFTPHQIKYRRFLGSLTNSIHPIWTSRNRTGQTIIKSWVNNDIIAFIGTLFEISSHIRMWVFKAKIPFSKSKN